MDLAWARAVQAGIAFRANCDTRRRESRTAAFDRIRFMRFFVPFLLAAAAYAGPCITADQTCTEWISLPGGHSRSMIYRTYSLDEKEREDHARAGRDSRNRIATRIIISATRSRRRSWATRWMTRW